MSSTVSSKNSAHGEEDAPRVAVYARVSTDGQDTGTQLADLRALAQQRGWIIVGEYVDQSVSGAETARPELERMMADARRGLFNIVCVWRFDRFARSASHLLSALDEFRNINVDFLSMWEDIDTNTPMGKMVFTLLGAMAEFERDLTKERVRAGVRHAQAMGKHCGRPRVEFDIRPAILMLRTGTSLRDTADALRVERSTLRRRLVEAGEWPLRPVGEIT